jgi:YVTN family beta-propeller protein
VVDLTTNQVEEVISTWLDGNLSQSIILNPSNSKAYLPLTRSNSTNPRLSFDTTVFPLITVIDLESGQMQPKEIISLPEADQPVGLPYDAAFSPDGGKLYLVNAASNDLTVISMETGMAVNHLLMGENPRGVVVSPDGKWVYVNNTLSGSVSIIDAQRDTLTKVLPVTQIPLPPVLLEGKRLFHSSRDPDLSRAAWISCNTCHWEGEHDGRTWTFDFSGPRNTTSLLGMINTYPLRWSAEWDESADSEFAITKEQFGTGLLDGGMHPTLGEPNTGRSTALDSLALFIDSLDYLPNYHKDKLATSLVEEGRMLYYDPKIGCGDCHSGPYYTDFQTHDVGTADGEGEVLGPLIDTPTLISLSRSAPYLHDGSAKTLLDVLTMSNPEDLHGVTSHLTTQQLDALVAYMLSLPEW